MNQPDAPEGLSRQAYTATTTEHKLDGTVVVTRVDATTELGGAQDWVAAIKASGITSRLSGIAMALLLLLGAAAAMSREWPSIAVLLAVGAVVSIATFWWAGLLAVAGGWLLYAGWKMKGPLP